MKTCRRCQIEKPASEFWANRRLKDGLQAYCKACQVAYVREWKGERPGYMAAYMRRWAKQNPTYMQVASANGRAKALGIRDRLTVPQWLLIKERYGGRCLRCGRPEPKIALVIEHVTPMSAGGSNRPENIQPLCFSCNARKWQYAWDYRPRWAARCPEILLEPAAWQPVYEAQDSLSRELEPVA